MLRSVGRRAYSMTREAAHIGAGIIRRRRVPRRRERKSLARRRVLHGFAAMLSNRVSRVTQLQLRGRDARPSEVLSTSCAQFLQRAEIFDREEQVSRESSR